MKLRSFSWIAVLILMAPATVFGTAFLWSGGGSGDWNDPGEWTCSPSCPPTEYPNTSDDDVVIDTVTTITIEEDLEIDDLSISGFDAEQPVIITTDSQERTVTCDTIVFTYTRFHLEAEAGLVAE
jgi:hypothetical protein